MKKLLLLGLLVGATLFGGKEAKACGNQNFHYQALREIDFLCGRINWDYGTITFDERMLIVAGLSGTCNINQYKADIAQFAQNHNLRIIVR